MIDKSYNLADIGFQITGIPGLNRLTGGNLRMEQTSGQDMFTLISNEAGKTAIEMHTRSQDFLISIEMPRVGEEAMNVQEVLKNWTTNPETNYKFISVSFRPTQGTVISSNECVVERPDWNNIQLSAEDQRVIFRIKMANCTVA